MSLDSWLSLLKMKSNTFDLFIFSFVFNWKCFIFSIVDYDEIVANITDIKNKYNIAVMFIGLGDKNFGKYEALVTDGMLFKFIGTENLSIIRSKLYQAMCK